MDRRKKSLFSIIIKFLIFLFAAVGILLCVLPAGGFISGSKIFFKFFTAQSVALMGLSSFFLAIKQTKAFKAGRYELAHTDEIFHLVLTVSVTLAAMIFCFLLLPAFLSENPGSAKMLLTPPQTILQIVVPVLSVFDFLVFTRPTTYTFSKKDILWSVIPPLYYLGFSRVGYVLNWNFGSGKNYPYFFLNYASPVGFFGFTGNPPYFMGVFWWLLAILALVVLISLLYTAIVNKAVKKYNEKLI